MAGLVIGKLLPYFATVFLFLEYDNPVGIAINIAILAWQVAAVYRQAMQLQKDVAALRTELAEFQADLKSYVQEALHAENAEQTMRENRNLAVALLERTQKLGVEWLYEEELMPPLQAIITALTRGDSSGLTYTDIVWKYALAKTDLQPSRTGVYLGINVLRGRGGVAPLPL